MLPNIEIVSTTGSCESNSEYVKPATSAPEEAPPTSSIGTGDTAKHITVVLGNANVVYRYDAATEHEWKLRQKIARLLKQ